ncbi:hypothetical protein Tco_0581464 [Tanacetum coccineum]
MSSECNNIKLAIQNAKSEVVCAMCKQCLITGNHDVYVLNYVNDMSSLALNKKQKANVSNIVHQTKLKAHVWKPKNVGMFDLKGKIIATSKSVCQSDCSKSDNACTSNPQELISRRFPCSTFSMTGCQNWLDTLLIPFLSESKPKDKENHGDNECNS